MRRSVRTVTTVVVALVVALSMSTAPVAALPEDDGLLGGDDSGLTDGLPVGDDTLNGTDTDDLPVAPDDGDTLPDESGLTDGLPNASDGLPDAPGLPSGPGGGGAPNASDVAGPEGIVDTDDSDVDLSRVDILGPLPDANGGAAADALSASTEDSPVSPSQAPVGALPTEQVPGPQALPVGSESQVDCAKPIGADDLPAEAVPYIDDLPVQPPNVPLVPTRVTSPENMAGLAFSFAPDQCEIYDPDDPSVDPTDPPENPQGEFRTARIATNDQEANYIGLSEGSFEEGGPGWDGVWAFQLTGERVAIVEDVTATDGRTENYAGVESDTRARRDLESSHSQVVVYVPGAGGLKTGYKCGNVPEHQVDPTDNPTATCKVDQPTPEVVTPKKVVDVITNPPSYELPQIEGDRIPVDL